MESNPAGPNKIKGEIYKWMASSNTCVDGITKAMNLMMENGRVPAEWKKSRTVMIPKAKKPETRGHRPIALTFVVHKIFMGLNKNKIVEHLGGSEQENEYQSGITGGR